MSRQQRPFAWPSFSNPYRSATGGSRSGSRGTKVAEQYVGDRVAPTKNVTTITTTTLATTERERPKRDHRGFRICAPVGRKPSQRRAGCDAVVADIDGQPNGRGARENEPIRNPHPKRMRYAPAVVTT